MVISDNSKLIIRMKTNLNDLHCQYASKYYNYITPNQPVLLSSNINLNVKINGKKQNLLIGILIL